MAEVPRALITGITGQDGSYLAEQLLEKGYEVHGLVRRSSSFNTERIDHLYRDPHEEQVQLFLHFGDLTDSSRLVKLLYELQPDEVYHLGAQSHVRVSFDMPEYTADVTGMGTVRLLEAIRDARRRDRASTRPPRARCSAPRRRRRTRARRSTRAVPYAVAKVMAHWITVNYRESYGMFACQRDPLQPRVAAPRRDVRHAQDHPRARADPGRPPGEALPRQPRRQARLGLRARLHRRDVADAPADEPDDYVIATGEMHSVREFLDEAAARSASTGSSVVEIDPSATAPRRGRRAAGRCDEGDARSSAGSRRSRFKELVRIMVDADVETLADQLAGRAVRIGD